MKTLLSIISTFLLLGALSSPVRAQWATVHTFTSSQQCCGDMSCPDKNTCFVLGAGTVYRTTNGGAAWDSLGANGLGGGHICFTDAKRGYACGNNGGIWITRNAGASWTAARTSTDQCAPQSFFALCFPTRLTGYAVGQNGAVLKTSDSGATWTCGVNPGPHLMGVYFLDANTGWAVGLAGRIMHTENGGYSWAEQTSAMTAPLQCVFFVDKATGFAGGGSANSVLLTTTDTGDTWKLASTTINGPIVSLWFLDAKNGFAAALGGVYKTTDGGAAWTLMNGSLAGPSAMCFPEPSTGYESSKAGVIAKYLNSKVTAPLLRGTAGAALRVFADGKGIRVIDEAAQGKEFTADVFDVRGRMMAPASKSSGSEALIPLAWKTKGPVMIRVVEKDGTERTVMVGGMGK
jgi:photosystem II stability/assembly factor-like uncharacterized protein